MAFTVKNLNEVDVLLTMLRISDHLKSWMSKELKKEVVERRDWLKPSSAEVGGNVFEVTFDGSLKNEVSRVVDWIAELDRHDRSLFSKIDRITWKQAVEYSDKWHEEFSEKVKKQKARVIPFDENCPVIYEHDNGMSWVWLKTDKAMDDERQVMGCNVLGRNNDGLGHDKGFFSLRDEDGRSYVTMELNGYGIVQSIMYGGDPVSEEYSKYVEEFHKFMVPELTKRPKEKGIDRIVWWDGDKEWFLDGKQHREDGPAVIRADGTKEWYRNDKRHRDDGPAVVRVNGDQEWYRNGDRHREDGPAIERVNGTKYWYKNGRFHRDGGPAIIRKEASLWYREGKLHREDGPATTWENGSEEWYRDGELHRVDGPAVTICGSAGDGEEWWVNGEPHRMDGPAIVKINGDREWWVDGNKMSEEEFERKTGVEKLVP